MKPLLVTVLFAAAFFPLATSAAVVLTVDLSVPNQITITSTTGASLATVTGPDNIGIYLDGLIGTTVEAGLNPTDPIALAVAPIVSNGLSSFPDLPSFNELLYRRSRTDPGLNVYLFNSGFTATFSAEQQAFKGSATWAIASGLYNLILANGASSGDVYFPADDLSDLPAATVIGTWEILGSSVIPEPSRYVLIMAGLVGLLTVHRRRRSKFSSHAALKALTFLPTVLVRLRDGAASGEFRVSFGDELSPAIAAGNTLPFTVMGCRG